MAQGVANIASGLFGGICATGTIARTATNVRAGAHGPIAGMLHAVFLLVFVLVAAQLASFIPLAALAGILAVVAWNMVEKQAFAALLRTSRGDAVVLLTTFFLTIFRDLTEAIVIGFALGSVMFICRMSRTTAVETDIPFVGVDKADAPNGDRMPRPNYEATANDPKLVVYRISGAFFFGAASSIGSILDRIADTHRALIVDFLAVPFLDSTGANTIKGLARKAAKKGVKLFLTGTTPSMRRDLAVHGVDAPLVQFEAAIDDALPKARQL